MSAVGFASIPVIPSLQGIARELEKTLVGPVQSAALKSGRDMENILATSAERASKKVASARKVEVAAAQSVADAEKQIQIQKSATEAASKKVEAAEQELNRTRITSRQNVEKAERSLAALRSSGKATADQLTDAENRVTAARLAEESAISKKEVALNNARTASLKTTATLESNERSLAKAQREAKDAADNLVAAEKNAADSQDLLNREVTEGTGLLGKFRQEVANAGGDLEVLGGKSESVGSRLMGGLKTMGTGALLGVGAQIGSTVTEGIGTAFSKGFSRLASIEQAQTMLEGLGNSGAQVQSIMDSAMDSVSGTAFGFGEAASMAATFSGAGIKESEELTRILSLVGDTAAITGSDFTEMGSIWTKVATGQKLQTTEMQQLMDRGLGVLPELQAHYGVTADEARKMVTEGKVSFEDFSEIMENMVGGSAALMGETFSGSAANMQAALGRLGAKLLDPIYSNAPAIFGAIGEGVDRLGEHMAPLIEEFSTRFGPMIEDFASRLGPWLVETIDLTAEKLKESIQWIRENEEGLKTAAVVVGAAVATWKLWSAAVAINNARILIGQKGLLGYIATTKMATAVTKLLSLATKANIFGLIVTGIAAAVAGLIWFFTKTETGREMWSKFTTAIVDGWNWTTEKLGAGVQWIQDKFNSFIGWISDAWSGITSIFKGDFTSELRESFGVEEDNPLISGFLKAHEILTGIPQLITGIADILFRGDFTGMPFGLEEDSGLVNFFFTIRDAAIKTGEIISAVWDGIVTVGKYAIAIIGTIVITPLILYWNLLSGAVKLGYEKLILPTFNAFAALGKWLWENALKPVFSGISTAWSAMGDALAVGWAWIDENIIQPFIEGWDVLGEKVSIVLDWVAEKWQLTQDFLGLGWLWIDENMIQPFMAGLGWLGDRFAEIITWIGDQWNLAQMLLAAGWLWIDGNVFQLFRDGAQWVGDKFQQVVDGIGLAWDAAKLMLHAGWLWIDQNVFSIFRLGVELMKSATETAMNGIGLAFDWLREKTATPINFVIREVYMGGIRQAWGAVARLVDVPELPEIQEIGGFAQGTARVPGARTRHDNMHMVSNDGRFGISLRGGEGVVVPEVVDGLGEKTINDLNSVGLRSGAQGVRTYMEHFGGFSNGGIIDSMIGFVSKHFPQLQMTSGWRFTDNGLHSRGQAADFSNQGQGGPSTPESRGLARAIYQNFPNQTEQLIHWKLDGWQNLLSGRPFDYGAATNAQHTDHVHWGMLSPLNYDADELDLSGGGSGVFETITAMAKRLWDGFIDKVPSFDGSGIIGDLPEAFLKKTAGTAWDYIKSLADKIMSTFTGTSGAGAEQWRDLARTALARFGYGEEYLDAMVKQIDIESSGDPNAINLWDENATVRGTPSRGLLQVIDPTYRDVRNKFPDAFEGLPDDPTHPLTNLVAGIGALERDWGGPAGGRWPTVDGYSEGGIINVPHMGIYDTGGVLPKGGVAVNTSAFDEVIVNGPNLQAINNLANNVGALVQKLSRDGDVDAFAAALAKELDPVVVELQRLADPSTVEGMTIRSVADRVLGMDLLPYGNVVETIMSAETDLLNARAGHADRLQAILDKEKALKDAQEELDALMSDESGMSVQNQRKLADAEKALEKAKADAAEASAEKQSAAAEKVANAEEKLSRVREDIAASADKDAEKRDEDIIKATDAVSKAESELVSARQESVKQLDHIMLPETVGGLIPQIGQAASALSGVLPEVSAGLSGLAATALPAGVSLGMAMAAVQVALDVAREIWDAIDEFIEHLNAIRIFEAEGWAKTFASIHEWTRLVEGQRQAVSALQQDLINAQISLTSATWDVRVAQFDQMRAQLEGVKNVATAQAALDAERERAARQALWETDSLNAAFDRYRWAQKVGWEDLLRDAVVITPEILALQHELNATKLLAEAANLEAAKNTLTAIHQMNLASINLGRTQAKLIDQQELLAKMEGTNYGLSGEESRVMSELADIMADNAKLEADRNSLGNTVKDALGTGLNFLTFGLFGNDLKNTQDSFDEAIRANNARIDRIMGQYKDLISEEDFKEMQKAMERAKAQYALGNTAGAEAILRGEVLGRAEQATRDAELDRDIYDWRQEQEDLRNSIEDTKLDLDYQTKLQEYIEKIFALESGAASEQYSADAIRESNPVVKAALEELAQRESNIAQSVVEKQPVNITLTGDAISTDKVRELLEELNTRSEDLDIRVTQLEEPEDDDLMDAINSRRTY